MLKGLHPVFRILLVIAILLGGAAAVAYFTAPSWALTSPNPEPPLSVSLTQPQNGSQIPVGWVVPVSAQVLSNEPVDTMSLYVDGVLYETKPVLAGEGTYQSNWSWQPSAAGTHSLVVRAQVGEWQGESNIVIIDSAPSQPVEGQPYFALEGDTLASIAESLMVDLGEIESLNPDMENGQAMSQGQEVMVPYSAPADWSPPAGAAPPQIPPLPTSPDLPPGATHPLWQWLRDKLGGVPVALPTAPTVIADDIGCSVRVYIIDHAANEAGFRLYRQADGQAGFIQIAEFGAHNGENAFAYEDENQYGHLTYYATAYNAAGESPSGYATTHISDPSCLTLAEEGRPIVSHVQITPQLALDEMYCYYSNDGLSWGRFPPSPNTFIQPDAGVFELKGLSTYPGNQTQLECWGWAGDSLQNLGRTTFNAPSGPDEAIEADSPNFLLEGQGEIVALGDWPPASDIPVPSNVQVTQDPDVCAQHAGLLAGFMCTQAIKDHYVVLVWDWYPFCWGSAECDTNIGGFNIYQSNDDGTVTLLKSLPKPDRRVVMLPSPIWPELEGTQHCFIIRAYAADDNAESADSNVACYQYGQLGLIHTELTPAAVRTSFVRDTSFNTAVYCMDLVTSGAGPIQSGPGNVIVGYDRDYDNGTEPFNCWEKRAFAYRGAMRFDLGSLNIATLTQARLEFGIVGREYSTNTMATNEVVSCMAQLRLATSSWDGWPNDSLIPGDPYRSLPHGYNVPYSGYPGVTVSGGLAHYSIDVTSAVQAWLDGVKPNLGFVISGPDESLPSNNMNCWNELGNIRLVLEYAEN